MGGPIKFFPGMSQAQTDALRQACTAKQLTAGDIVFREGDLGDSMWIIETGEVEIIKTVGDTTRVLAKFKEGEIFGEMSFVDGRRRSAGARALTESALLSLGRPKFEQVAREHPQIAGLCFSNLANLIADRLRTANETYREAIGAYLEAIGAKQLHLDGYVEGLRPVRMHLTHGVPLDGKILQVDRESFGPILHFRAADGHVSLIPYHSLLRIEVI
jgi:CRP-like cAMP-binding protein